MNVNSILKKVLPVICTILLIVVITITATAIKNSSAKTPDLGDAKEEVYLSITEKLGGKEFTYSITKGELYDDLKGQIGLSTVITMTNKAILKQAVSENSKKSYWESVTAEEITEAINKDVYGEDNIDEDGKVTITDEEEKADLEKAFTNTMYTGYGYNVSNGIYSDEIKEHYNLVLAKKLYGKEALAKEVKEADEDEPYFTDDDVEEYYEENYGKNFYAIVVPFKSSNEAKLLLQQLGYVYNSDSKVSAWVTNSLQETEAGSGIYESVKGDNASVYQVVKAFIDLYNIVNNEKLVEGTVTLKQDSDGKNYYEFSEGCDYAVINNEALVEAAKNAVAAIKEAMETEKSIEERKEVVNAAITAVTALKAALANETGTETILNKLNSVLENYQEAEYAAKEESLVSEIEEIINTYENQTIIFNKDNKESAIYWDFARIEEYDSSFSTKLESNYYTYYPLYGGEKQSSLNNKDQKWYSKSPFSSSSVYYYVMKLGEEAKPSLESVKDEILAKLEEEAYTDEVMEEKMCELRAEYGFKVLDKELQEDYITVCEGYEVEYKKNKKKSTLIAKAEKDGFTYEVTVEDFFKYMEKTLGLATAISEVSSQRLVINSYFNKYYDYASEKWLGDEGEELRDNIIESVENQRLSFLSGGYSYYGYDPSTMTWEEFLYQMNGVSDEYELAELMLYSNVASDYIAEAVKFVSVSGETFEEIKFDMDYSDALTSKAWEVLKKSMENVYTDAFTVTGEHFLVSTYESVKASLASDATPVDPKEWTAEQKELAKELIEAVNDYLQYAEGSYATKLEAVVDAFDAAPYAVKDGNGNYVNVVDSDNQPYKYVLTYANGKEIDLAKYKSAGLYVKYENLGSFSEGSMVEPFENAAKEIWLADKAAGEVTDNITVYEISEGTDAGKHYIETEFGYHLYINLGSSFKKAYTSKVEENGNVVDATEESIIPSLYEIRLNNLINAYSALITDETSEEEAEKINAKIDELQEYLSEEAKTAITAYYDTVKSEITGSYFSSLLQQNELQKLIEGEGFKLSSSYGYVVADVVKLMEVNTANTFESNLKYLEAEDLDAFDITSAFVNANK